MPENKLYNSQKPEPQEYRVLLQQKDGERELWLNLKKGDPSNSERIKKAQQLLDNQPKTYNLSEAAVKRLKEALRDRD